MRAILAVAFFCVFSISVQGQVSSVYTDLDDRKCKTVELTDEEGGSYKGVCKGVGGYKLQVIEGDLRQTITIVDPRGKEHPLEFWNLTGAFSSVGQQAEWRMRGKRPIALIVRLNVSENVEDASKPKGYLVVAKITDRETCVTHFLAPTRSHNYEARKAADNASLRPCLKPDSE